MKGQLKEALCNMIKSKYADSYTVCVFIGESQGVFWASELHLKLIWLLQDSAASDFLLSTRSCHGKIAAAA